MRRLMACLSGATARSHRFSFRVPDQRDRVALDHGNCGLRSACLALPPGLRSGGAVCSSCRLTLVELPRDQVPLAAREGRSKAFPDAEPVLGSGPPRSLPEPHLCPTRAGRGAGLDLGRVGPGGRPPQIGLSGLFDDFENALHPVVPVALAGEGGVLRAPERVFADLRRREPDHLGLGPEGRLEIDPRLGRLEEDVVG